MQDGCLNSPCPLRLELLEGAMRRYYCATANAKRSVTRRHLCLGAPSTWSKRTGLEDLPEFVHSNVSPVPINKIEQLHQEYADFISNVTTIKVRWDPRSPREMARHQKNLMAGHFDIRGQISDIRPTTVRLKLK